MNRNRNLHHMLLGCVLVAVCISQAAQAQITPAGTSASFDFGFTHNGSTVTLPTEAWVPQETGAVRGMIFFCPGLGGDSRSWISDDMKLRARSLGFGIVGWRDAGGGGPGGGDYQGVNDTECETNLQGLLNTTATLTGQDEVRNSPVAYYGFSKGGWVANTFTSRVPSRSIGFVADKSATWVSPTSAESKKAPGMFVVGSADTVVSPSWSWSGFDSWRNSNQANTAQTVMWGAGHSGTLFGDFPFAFLAEAARERLPDGQTPSHVPGNPLALNDVDDSGVYLSQASVPNGSVMTPVPNTHLAPADEYALPVSNSSWFANRTSALVSNAHKYMPSGNPLSVMIAGSPLVEFGQSVTVNISLNGDAPASVQNIMLYRNDMEIDITADLLADGIASLTYTADESGIQTLVAAMSCDESGVMNIYSNYDVSYVQPEPLPEPASLLILGFAGAALLRRKKY